VAFPYEGFSLGTKTLTFVFKGITRTQRLGRASCEWPEEFVTSGRRRSFCDDVQRPVCPFVFGNVTRRRETCPEIEVGFSRLTWLRIVFLDVLGHPDVAELM
jgi:hypothetical protein